MVVSRNHYGQHRRKKGHPEKRLTAATLRSDTVMCIVAEAWNNLTDGIDMATGAGRSRGSGWGPYQHTPPSQWKDGQNTSEFYRRCCTSVGWVAQALALRLMRAEKTWDHDAFFDYVDRWMCENDAGFVKTIKEATGRGHDKEWARQGQAWDAFTNEMWAKHRRALEAPTEGWKQAHEDAYYRNAIQKLQ